jgi:hypothetical protein
MVDSRERRSPRKVLFRRGVSFNVGQPTMSELYFINLDCTSTDPEFCPLLEHHDSYDGSVFASKDDS